MFQFDGYLTLPQITAIILDEFEHQIDSFGDDETSNQRRLAWLAWIRCTILEGCTDLFLLYPEKEPVGISAEFLLLPQSHDIHSAVEIPLVNTPEGYSEFQELTMNMWIFIEPFMGEVRIPSFIEEDDWRPFWPLFTIQNEHNKDAVKRIRKHLTPFAGRLVAARTETVMKEIKRTKNDILKHSEFGKSSNSDFNLDCIDEAYPHGITGTWAEIEKKTGISRRTILRTLEAHGRTYMGKTGRKFGQLSK